MKIRLIFTFLFSILAMPLCFAAGDLDQTRIAVACEAGNLASVCGKHRAYTKWQPSGYRDREALRNSRTVDGVFRRLNLPDTDDSQKKIANFVSEGDEIIQKAKGKIVSLQEQIAKGNLSTQDAAAKDSHIAKLRVGLSDDLRSLETRVFGKLNITRLVNTPSSVFYENAMVDISNSTKGYQPASPFKYTDDALKASRKNYSDLVKAARQPKFNLNRLTRIAGGGFMTALSVGASAAGMFGTGDLLAKCVSQLGMKMTPEETFQIARYAIVRRGLAKNDGGCDNLSFTSDAVDTLISAGFMTPATEDFFKKFGELVSKRLDIASTLPDFKFDCSEFSWKGTKVKVEDKKLFITSEFPEDRPVSSRIEFNSLGEWNEMSFRSDDPSYRDYLTHKVHPIKRSASSDGYALRQHFNPFHICQADLAVSKNQKAHCESAKALMVWNHYAGTCDKDTTSNDAANGKPKQGSGDTKDANQGNAGEVK